MELFFDTEFTGLHQKTTLISLGIVSIDGLSFYSEFTDYDISQVDKWVYENVLSKCTMVNDNKEISRRGCYSVKGDTNKIKKELLYWLGCVGRKDTIFEMWSDCLAYDWVLFNNLFDGALNIPKNIYYIPFDICTLFKIKGIDPDISREEFCGIGGQTEFKHTAIWDAAIIKECYKKLMSI